MNLQYISDSTGKTTGVFIPITEWNHLKRKYHDIEMEAMEVPEWQKEQVRNRMEEYKNKPGQVLDFEIAIDDIENNII